MLPKEKKRSYEHFVQKAHIRLIWADTKAMCELLRELLFGVVKLHTHLNTICPAGVIPAGHICASDKLMSGRAGFYQALETQSFRYVSLAVFRLATVWMISSVKLIFSTLMRLRLPR